MTLEQQRAIAIASAKLKLQEEEKKNKVPSVADQTTEALGSVSVSSASPEFASMVSTPEAPTSVATKMPTGIDKKVTEEVPFESLYKNPENLNIIKDYAEVRFGKAGKQEPNESDENYAKRFMTAMRQVEYNTSLNAVPELNFIYNAKPDEAIKTARAFELYEKVPYFFQKGGQPGIRPLAESVLSAVSEPTNIISFGIGAAARQQAARAAIKTAISAKTKAVVGGASAEAVLGTAQSAVSLQRDLKVQQVLDTEKVDIELNKAKELLRSGEITQEQFNTFNEKQKEKVKEINSRQISKSEAAIGGAIGAVFGGFEARAAFKTPKLTTKKDLENVLEGRKKLLTETVDTASKDLVDAFDQQLDETLRQFDIFEGRKILDQLNPPTEITQAELKTDINTRAINVAKAILLEDPAFSDVARRVGTKQQKVSSAVSEVFGSLDKVNDVALTKALEKEGLTLQEFSKVTGTTVSDAASIMQAYSALSRVLSRQAQIDPDAQKVIDDMFLRKYHVPDFLITLKDGINRFERESKALVVSSIATTVRNVLGTSTSLTFDAFSNFIESALYQSGKVLKTIKEGKFEKEDLSVGLNTVVRDTFNTLTYLTNGGITAEVVDKILVDNPRIKEQLFSALQETGNQNLSKVSKMANTFNVAQDAIFRRAIFTASVERQMRKVGMDMYAVLANDKAIPTDVVKNAADEALKGTFSYMPKQGVAHHFVKLFEQVPGGSLLVTFPRFMTNAMAFQYKYSPIGGAFGTVDLGRAAYNKKKDPQLSARLYTQGLEKLSKGMVGTAALVAATNYRMNNQESPWYTFTNEDGGTVDTRALFPIAPYLAVGEFIAKSIEGKKSNTKEIIETLVGMKIPGGAQGYILDQITAAYNNTEGKEAERLEKSLGAVFGDFANRFIQPGQPIFNFFELFNTESQVARDPNVITSDDIVTESALNRIKAKVPGFKEELPEAKRYLRKETPVRAGEFFNTLMGVRLVPRANDIEREFVRLSLDPYKYFGSTGDKVLDRAVMDEASPFINQRVVPLLKSDRYNKMTDAQKTLAMGNNMRESVTIGKEIARNKMLGKDRDRMDKLIFNNKTAEERKAINELYAKENNGTTMDEAKDYKQVYKYEALIQGYR